MPMHSISTADDSRLADSCSSREGRRQRGLSRRDWLKATGVAIGGVTLPELLRLRSGQVSAGEVARETAVIFVQLGGGASQFETYDPKPDAPAEYRGAMRPISTSVPGVHFCELLPRQAQLMDDITIVRSVQHTEGSHIALHVVETGYFLRSSANALRGEMPSMGAVVARTRGATLADLPASVSFPKPFAYSGPAHLGGRNNYFSVDDDPNSAEFSVKHFALPKNMTLERLQSQQALRKSLDHTRRIVDVHGQAEAVDAFQQQAIDLLTGARARQAFDLQQEPDALRDRYGRHTVGQRLLLARRLVEAGVPLVCVRMADWDDHHNLVAKMSARAPQYDGGLAALITDLKERGLAKQVLVVAMGEFGRTPRVNKDGGRDHWPAVASVLLSGGNYRYGQVVGATDAIGGVVTSAPYAPQNVLAMVYRHLGIDPGLTFPDHTGRPRHILEERRWISEML